MIKDYAAGAGARFACLTNKGEFAFFEHSSDFVWVV